MSEGDKEKDTDRVDPLEAKPGGKAAGTKKIVLARAIASKKEEDEE